MAITPANAAEIFALADVDGGLIGEASLKAGNFLGLWERSRRLNLPFDSVNKSTNTGAIFWNHKKVGNYIFSHFS